MLGKSSMTINSNTMNCRYEGRRPMHRARLEPRGTVCSESPPEKLLLPGTTKVEPPTTITQLIHHRLERINKLIDNKAGYEQNML